MFGGNPLKGIFSLSRLCVDTSLRSQPRTSSMCTVFYPPRLVESKTKNALRIDFSQQFFGLKKRDARLNITS